VDLFGDDRVLLDERPKARSFKFQDFGHVVGHVDVSTGSSQPLRGDSTAIGTACSSATREIGS